MQVIAFSTPTCPDWRWRIVNYAGEVIEESQSTFRTIATGGATSAPTLSSTRGSGSPRRTARRRPATRGPWPGGRW